MAADKHLDPERAAAVRPHAEAIAKECGIDPARLVHALEDLLSEMIRAADASRRNGKKGGRPRNADAEAAFELLQAMLYFQPIDSREIERILSSRPAVLAAHVDPLDIFEGAGIGEAPRLRTLEERLRDMAEAMRPHVAAAAKAYTKGKTAADRRRANKRLRNSLGARLDGGRLARDLEDKDAAHQRLINPIAAGTIDPTETD